MKLTASELKQLEKKKPNRLDRKTRRIQLLSATKGKMDLENMQKLLLEKTGEYISQSTIQTFCQRNGIEYFKRTSAPKNKKRGAGIVIGESK